MYETFPFVPTNVSNVFTAFFCGHFIGAKVAYICGNGAIHCISKKIQTTGL